MAIGEELNRESVSVKNAVRHTVQDRNTGKWSDEEVMLLTDAVHSLTDTREGELVFQGIPWKEVAAW